MAVLDIPSLAASLANRPVPVGVVAKALPALRLIALAGVKEHFQTQTGPDGKKWTALAHARINGGNQILQDTGRLKNSVTSPAQGGGLLLRASHPAANLHQYGGTVRPKRAKMLAIPLTKEAKRIGSPRQNKFPRPLFVFARNGRAFLAESTGEGELTIHYVLKRSVVVPARPFLGFSRRTQEKMERLLQDRIAAWLAAAFGDASAYPPGVQAPR